MKWVCLSASFLAGHPSLLVTLETRHMSRRLLRSVGAEHIRRFFTVAGIHEHMYNVLSTINYTMGYLPYT